MLLLRLILIIALALVVAPPAHAQDPVPFAQEADFDHDADGVTDAEDPCPRTPARSTQTVPGCSALQVIARPGVLLARIDDQQRRLEPSLKLRIPRFSTARARGRAAEKSFALAAAALAAGDPCRAAAAGAKALDTARTSAELIADNAKTYLRKVRGRRGPVGDADERYLQIGAAELAGRRSAATYREAARTASIFKALCKRTASRASTVQGRVKAIDPATGIVLLDTGTRVVIPGGKEGSLVSPGLMTRFPGYKVDGLGHVASAAVPVETIKVTLAESDCIGLRIRPAQLGKENVLHPPAGYMINGTLTLEPNSWLAAERNHVCAAHPEAGKTYRYDLSITVAYKDEAGMNQVQQMSVSPGALAVPLPAGIAAGKTLRVIEYRSTCTGATCEAAELIAKRDLPLRIVTPDEIGRAAYAQKVFALPGPGSYGATSFNYAGSPLLAGTQYRARGFGLQVTEGGSSKPNVFAFDPGQTFAVPDASWKDQAASDTFGVRSGLHMARVEGVRDGSPYWYSLELDQVVTDAACVCATNDARYRVPWVAGTSRKVTQGNDGGFTHGGSQQYAFDFSHPLGTPIPAARGGKVISVREAYTETSNPKECKYYAGACRPANELMVQHMDGQISVYFHMRKNGVVPEIGDYVKRGQIVAYSGNTGNSTGPHLHFHVVTTAANETIEIRFHGKGIQGTDYCLIPEKGENLVSNNEAPA